MTKPIDYDYFGLSIDDAKSIAVLTEEITIETATTDFDKVFQRGIYTFFTVNERNVFTKVCNDDRNKTVAFRYNRKT